jgi:hypothetical protein
MAPLSLISINPARLAKACGNVLAALRQESLPQPAFNPSNNTLDYGANRSPAILFIARQGDLRGKVLRVRFHGKNHEAGEQLCPSHTLIGGL